MNGVHYLKALRLLIWATLVLMAFATVFDLRDSDWMSIQSEERFRWISGFALWALILFQWCLSLGRLVYKAKGSKWDDWVEIHQNVAMALPLALLIHSIQFGYGMLAILPLALLFALLFGWYLTTSDSPRKWLTWHVLLSAITLGCSVVHLWRVVFYS